MQREAKDVKAYPRIPLDQAAVIIGTNYTLANGQKARAVADPQGAMKDAKGNKFSLVPARASGLSDEDAAILKLIAGDE